MSFLFHGVRSMNSLQQISQMK